MILLWISTGNLCNEDYLYILLSEPCGIDPQGFSVQRQIGLQTVFKKHPPEKEMKKP